MPDTRLQGERRQPRRRRRPARGSRLLALSLAVSALVALPVSAVASAAAPAPGPGTTVPVAATGTAEWPQLQGGPAHTGVAGTDPTLDLAGLQRLHTEWSHPINTSQAGGHSGAVIAGGLAYIADGGLTAYRVSTGALAWHTDLPLFESVTPAVGEGVVVIGGELVPHVGASRGEVVGLDALTGQLLWTRRVPDLVAAAPAIVRDAVLVTAGNTLRKLRLRTGAVVWTSAVAATSPPSIVGNQVFVSDQLLTGSGPLTVSSLEISTGAVRWTQQLAASGGCGSYENGTVAVGDEIAYVGQCYGELFAFRTQGGAPVWRRRVPPVFWPLALTPDRVITATSDVTAVDRATGSVRWSEPQTATHNASPSPVVVGTTLVLGEPDGLALRDPTDGADLGSIRLGGTTLFTAVGEGHVIVVVSSPTTSSYSLVALAPAARP